MCLDCEQSVVIVNKRWLGIPVLSDDAWHPIKQSY